MAVSNIAGAETGGLDELSAATSVTAQTTVKRSGSYAYELNSGTDQFDFDYVSTGASHNPDQAVCFAIRVSSKASSGDILEIRSSAGGLHAKLVWEADDDIRFEDSTATTLLTITDPITVDTWHFFEIFWATSTSSWQVILDGVSKGSGSSATFGTISGTAFNRFFAPQTNTYYDDLYCLTNVSVFVSERHGPAEVFGFQNTKTGTAPDAGLDGSSGTNLNSGQWSNLGNTPLNETTNAIYSASSANQGTVDLVGPSGSSDIDGDSNIKAIKGHWRLLRGNGSGTTHRAGLGDSGDGDSAASFVVNLTTSYANYTLTRATNLPTASQFIRQGFLKSSGAREIDCAEMWAMILHVPAAGAEIFNMVKGAVQVNGKNLVTNAREDLVVTKGALQINGKALVTNAREALAVAKGALQINGKALVTNARTQFDVAKGALQVNGKAFIPVSPEILAVAKGALVVNGKALVTNARENLVVTKGALAINGKALVTNAREVLSVAKGAIQVNGKAFIASGAEAVLVAKGALVVNGKALVTNAREVLAVAKGAVQVNGKNLVGNATTQVAVAKGALVVNGKAFITNAVENLQVAKGALVVNGKNLVGNATTQVAVAKGALVVNGKAFVTNAVENLVVAKGALAVNGKNLVANASEVLAVAKGALVINGKAFVTLTGNTITVAKGAITLSGKAFTFAAQGAVSSLHRAVNRTLTTKIFRGLINLDPP